MRGKYNRCQLLQKKPTDLYCSITTAADRDGICTTPLTARALGCSGVANTRLPVFEIFKVAVIVFVFSQLTMTIALFPAGVQGLSTTE